MNHSYIFYTPETPGQPVFAEDVRLGDTLYLGHGASVGPITKIEFDWANGWATFTDVKGQEYQCFISEVLSVARKGK